MRRVLAIYILRLAQLSPVTFRVFVGGRSAKSCCCSPCIHLFRPHWLHASFVCRPSYVLQKKYLHNTQNAQTWTHKMRKWHDGALICLHKRRRKHEGYQGQHGSEQHIQTRDDSALHWAAWQVLSYNKQFYKSLRSPAATYWSTLQRLQELYGWTFDNSTPVMMMMIESCQRK